MSSDQLNQEIYNKINSNKNQDDDGNNSDDDHDGDNNDHDDDDKPNEQFICILKHVCYRQFRDSTPLCIKQFLTYNNSIDLTKGNGIYFKQVIFARDAKALQILLDYQEEYMKKMEIIDQYTLPKARFKLRKILQNALYITGSDEQMDIVLEKYIPHESDYDSDEQLEDINVSFQKKNFNQLKSYQD